MSSEEYTPEKFRQKLEEILESDASIEEKINAGIRLIDSSRLYFEHADPDVRAVISQMMHKETGKTHPHNLILRQIWERQDEKTQFGIDHQWKEQL